MAHHVYLHNDARAIADRAKNEVVQFYNQNDKYPDSLSVTTLEIDSHKKIGLYYSINEGKPMLFYRVTWIPFETYQLDFKALQWIQHG
ncbi:hypothetical protein [Microbulbifer sp. TRSA007]|uniref:hypothetical protein n=1 Tax=Microbulbifer sp. TRSA007 TaxID=3243384 RepID=UPI004039EDAF